jgi:hypothetical protein
MGDARPWTPARTRNARTSTATFSATYTATTTATQPTQPTTSHPSPQLHDAAKETVHLTLSRVGGVALVSIAEASAHLTATLAPTHPTATP